MPMPTRPTKRDDLERGTKRIAAEKNKVREPAAPLAEDVPKRYRGAK